MPTYLAPGVYMEEVDKGPKPIEAVATAVAGFVGLAARGPLNRPISVNSWSDYVRVFGGLADDSLMSHSVFGYFNNGGQNAYAVRVANQATMRRARYILSYRPVGRLAAYSVRGLIAGATSAVLADASGLAVGDKLTLTEAAATATLVLTAVDMVSGMVTWATPLAGDYSTNATMAMTTPAIVGAPTITAGTDFANSTVIKLSTVTGVGAGDTLHLMLAAASPVIDLQILAVDGATKQVTVAPAVTGTFTATGSVTVAKHAAQAQQFFRSLAAAATSAVFPVTDGLPVGTRLELHEDLPSGSNRETVTVTAVDQATGTVTWAPGLAHTFFQPAIAVAPGAAYPTEYALKSAAASGAGLIELSDSRGLATGDRIALWENADAPEIQQIVAIGADGKITLSATLANGYSMEAVVAAHPGIMLTAAPDPVTVTGGSDAAQSNGMGTWGNDIRVRIDDTALVRTTLTAAISTPVTEAVLKSTKGIAADSVVRFYDRVSERAEYRVVTAVFSGNRVAWDGAQPLTGSYTTEKTEVSTAEFRLTVRHRWSGVTEGFDGLSMQPGYTDRYAVTVVNETRGEAKASGLVQIESLVDAAWTDVTPEHRLPLAMKKGEWHNLRGGRNGSVDITVSDFKGQNLGPDNRTGLACFEGVDQVTMVILADAVGKNEKGDVLFAAANVQALHEAMLEHAESMADRFAIVDCRAGLDLQAVQEQRGELSSKYGAFYYPWIYVDNPLSPTGAQKLVPPSGHIAGLYARVDQTRGVHKAPANELLFGARGLEVQVSMAEQNLLNPMAINCIRKFPGRGTRVWGARTLADDASWRYINVRRLFLQIEESIDEGTQWTVFEPNDQTLWAKIRRDVGAFLYRFYLSGAFFGTTPQEAFFVKCDAETNPPEVIDAGQVVIEVGIAPVKPAEFVIFRVGQKPTGSSVSE